MNEREKSYVEAAKRAITRYGMKRTTMNDIAAEAGVSRQTLYTVYANKDEVLRATIRLDADNALEAIESECAKAKTLGEKLEILFDYMAFRPYKLMQSIPDPEDLLEGINAAGRDEIRQSNERYRELIEGLLVPYTAKIKKADLGIARLADMLRTAITALKHKAETHKQLTEQLGTLKQVVLAALKEK